MTLWGQEWVDEYLRLGSRESYHNQPPLKGVMLALLGQAVRHTSFRKGNAREHVRVMPTIIQPPQTGKGVTVDFGEKVGKAAGFDFGDLHHPSDASFVESSNGEDESVAGIADKNHIITFREFGDVLTGSQQGWAEGLHTFLIHIYDGKSITVPRAGEERTMNPVASIIGTCTPPSPDEVNVKKLFGSGLMARPLYFYRDIPPELRDKMIDENFDAVDNPGADSREDIEEVADTLREMQETIGGASTTFSFADGVTDSMKEMLKELYTDSLDEASPPVSAVIEPARSRYQMHFLRIACLMAALDECSTEVEADHAEWAMEYVELSWTQMMNFLEDHFSDDSNRATRGIENGAYRMQSVLLQADEPMLKTEVADELGKSARMVQEYANILDEQGILEKGGGRGKGPRTYWLNYNGSK